MLDHRHAALEHENAELRRQLDEYRAELQQARHQQTATAEVLQVINSSPGDIAPVFDAIVEKAHALCGAAYGSLQLWDGEKFRGVAMRGFSEPMVEALRRGYSPYPNMPCRRLVEGESVAHCADLAEIDDPTAQRGGVALAGIRTILYVALRKDDVLLGQIVAARKEVQPFSEKEIALVENFAAQAVIAIENARLLTEAREALDQQTATAEVLQVINSSPGELAPVFDAMLEKARRLCDAAVGSFWSYDGQAFQVVASTVGGDVGRTVHPGPGVSLDRIARGESVVQIDDVASEEAYRTDAVGQARTRLAGTRTALAVGLRKDRTLIGVITAGRQEARPFSAQQIALLQNFAAQAVIAIENARLIAETREALDQQTATAEVLQVINSSPGDLAPVFDAILEKAHALCDASRGTLFLFDGEVFRAAASQGYPGGPPERMRRGIAVSEDPRLAALLAGERLIHVPDLTQLDDPIARAVAERGGVRTNLLLPLRKDNVLLGVLSCNRSEVRPFTDKQIALLQNFAAQAVIAMENARLITETREALEQQTATAEVLQVINSSPGDLAPVFEAILEKAHRLCDVAHGSLQLYDGVSLRAVATHGVSDAFADILRHGYRAADSPASRGLIEGARSVQIADCAEIDHPVFQSAAEFAGIRTVLFVPLRKDDALLGLISSARREVRPFSDKEIALLQNFAAQAVIAMENARLLTETREALEQQTATAEVLQVINSSPGDLAPVFDAMLDKAMRLCDGARGTLWMFDGERMHAASAAGYSAELAQQLREWREIHPFQRRLARGERVFQILDLSAEELYRSGNTLTTAAVDVGGIRTAAFVALVKDAATLGGFTIGRREVRPFSDKQIALLQNFAAQAVIAMENARLITETREALEQQTATAEVLQVINSSPGDLAPVFDAMLEKAMRLCDVAFGFLTICDGKRFRPAALRGVPPELAKYFASGMDQPRPGEAHSRLLAGEELIHSIDQKDEEPYRQGSPLRRAVVDLGGARTALVVALRKDRALLGVFTVYRKEVRPFSDKQIALLQNFAAQAVIAMENARLLTETREALEQQTATAEVLQVINSSPGDLASVFDAMLDKAHSLCGIAQGSLELYDGQNFRAVATRGLADSFADELRQGYPASDNPATRPLIEGEPLSHILDVEQHEFPFARGPVDAVGARTLLCVPLRRDDKLLGMIASARREVRPFSDKQIALLQNFAAQAVIAMENARLLGELRERTSELALRESELRESNDRYGLVSQAAAEGIYDWDISQNRLWVSSRLIELFGWEETRSGTGERPSQDWNARVHPEDFESYRAALRAALKGETARLHCEYRIRLSSGDYRWVEDHAVPVRDERGWAVRLVGAVSDVTDRKQGEQELREALEQQTATAEVLQVINSSPGDLAPVFDAMLEKALRLGEAAHGHFALYDGEVFRTAAVRGEKELADWFRQLAPWRAGTGTTVERIIAGEHIAHIADVMDDDAYRQGNPVRRALVEVGGCRTMLSVALRRENALLGVFTIYRQEVRPFSDKQIALLQNFAAQAVIAMENARLITETREALEQQTATAEVLQVINSSPGDLAPVFDAMVERAARLCEADEAALRTFDGELLHLVAVHGSAPDVVARLRQLGPTRAFGLYEPFARGERIVQVADVRTTEVFRDNPVVRERLELRGIRTWLAVALHKEDALLGVINVHRHTLRPFTEKQVALLQTFAAQAVIAIENARLITETRDRTRDLQESLEYQTAISEVLKVISGSAFELQPVLETVVATAVRLCHADQAVIYRLRDGEYRWAAGHSLLPEYERIEREVRIRPGAGTLVGRVGLQRDTVQILDAWTDPLYEAKADARTGDIHTMLGVPLLWEGSPIGVIGLARRRIEGYTEKEIALVTTFADQAVIAIENARLLSELRERTDELARSVEELKMLGEVGQAVSSTLDLRSVLSAILTASLGVTWANAGAIFRYSRAERAFRLVEAVGWDEALAGSVRELRVAEAETAMGEAAARRAPIQIGDLAQRPSAPLRDASLAAGFHSALIVPLVGAERIFGTIILMRQEAGEFPAETVRLMQTLASQSVLAIQNARLFREIADKSEQLALASQHKSQFLANMSHELRTPLNAILGYAELLVDGIYGVLPERAQGVLERVQNNGRHLLALINDVLDLAKIEAGQLNLTLEDYNLPELVRGVVTATEPLAAAKGLRLTAMMQDGMPTAHGDARRVSQVLLNLVGNAIKFTDHGDIEISASAANRQFALTVRDTGPGIADADQERIFGEFQQIDDSSTRKKGGTGLGLAISKRMVEMQGGVISVESVLGQGSTFRVVLPVHVDEMMEAA